LIAYFSQKSLVLENLMLIMLNLTPVFWEEKIHFSAQKSLANLKTFINFATESSHCSTISLGYVPVGCQSW